MGWVRNIAATEIPQLNVNPLALRYLVALDASLHEFRHLGERFRLALKVAHIQVNDSSRMNVRINQSGQHQAAVHILDLGPLPYIGLRARAAAHIDDTPALNGDRGRDAMRGIDGIDLPIGHDQVGGLDGGQGGASDP